MWVFWRYFETGVLHAPNPWLRERFGSFGGEVRRFVPRICEIGAGLFGSARTVVDTPRADSYGR